MRYGGAITATAGEARRGGATTATALRHKKNSTRFRMLSFCLFVLFVSYLNKRNFLTVHFALLYFQQHL